MTTIKDIAWIAGILEGEGSFGLTNNGRCPCIWLGMTDKDVVERVRNIMGRTRPISITEDKRKESYKSSYRLTINGQRAIEWMMTIYSLMGERRKLKIKELLDIWKKVELKHSQIRDLGPVHRLIRNMMVLGLTEEQAGVEIQKLGIQ